MSNVFVPPVLVVVLACDPLTCSMTIHRNSLAAKIVNKLEEVGGGDTFLTISFFDGSPGHKNSKPPGFILVGHFMRE